MFRTSRSAAPCVEVMMPIRKGSGGPGENRVWKLAWPASTAVTPPSSVGASSYEDKADSYNYDTYSDSLKSGVVAPRVRDGDARHIAMKIISMRAGSQSVKLIVMLNQINARYISRFGVRPSPQASQHGF